MVQTNSHGMVLDIQQSYQLETSESQDLCGPWSVASLCYAGLPGKGPRGSAEQIDQLADKWADQFLGGGHTAALGSNIPDMYNFLTASVDPQSGQRNLHWWDLVSPDVNRIRAAVRAGYPVLITVNEANIKEKSTGKQPPYPWTIIANHIIPVVGIDQDGDFICADELNNNFQGHWPVTYVASIINPLWASIVQVIGPDANNPWLKKIPTNDPNDWPVGFNAQNFSTGPSFDDLFKKQAEATWDVFFTSILKLGTGPNKATGIYSSWLAEWRQGRPRGTALTNEYYVTRASDGAKIACQEFSNGRCEWDGKPHWFPATFQ